MSIPKFSADRSAKPDAPSLKSAVLPPAGVVGDSAFHTSQLAVQAVRDAVRCRHRCVLYLAAVVMVSAFLLDVRADQRVALGWLPRVALPGTCMSRLWFGWECPGCGLTRSIVHLAHGRWKASLAAHRLGWLIGLLVAVQIPYRLAALSRQRESRLPDWICRWGLYLLAALLIANWLVNIWSTSR